MTISNDTPFSFGRYLQACRKIKKLSLDAIAGELKVGTGVLLAIENEDLSKMPDEVFAKGFLRGFSKIVGADESRVVDDYLKRRHQLNWSIQSSRNLDRENDLFWRKLALSAAVLLSLILLTVFVLSGRKAQDPGMPAAGPSDSAILAQDVSPDARDNTGTVVSPSETTSQTIRLSVIAVEETWIKIIIDNGQTREYSLRPGDHLYFEAVNGYNLLIGNAAGIKLVANGIPVDLPGEKGKVVNIEIP